jgi:hypothetical protein
MTDALKLDGAELLAAGRLLIEASATMTSGDAGDLGYLPSLTGIGAEVDRYLVGLGVARASLADAAKTASRTLASVTEESGELDALIAGSLPEDFALGGRRS